MTPDFGSPTWRAIEEILAARIEELHIDNESPALGPEQTAFLRGQIYALRGTMNLPKADKKPPIEPDPYEAALFI